MPSTSRREFLSLSGMTLSGLALSSATLTACGGTATGPARPTGPAAHAIERLRIDTPAGTFDAVAAGPADGRKVLLLHGFPEFGIEFSAQLTALAAAGYRAVAPDQRGYSPGVRPKSVEQYTVDHAVADVWLIADSLGWQRFDLAGHDWGAVVAWIAAADRPQRVRTLTAMAVPHPAAFYAALHGDPEQQRKSKYMDMFRAPSPAPENAILHAGPPKLPGVPPARCAEYFRRLSAPGALTAALNWYRANDFAGHDRPVSVPTLFLAGSKDATVAAAGVAATRHWVRGPYRLVTLDAGHNIPEQRPAETSRLLLEHLAAHPR